MTRDEQRREAARWLRRRRRDLDYWRAEAPRLARRGLHVESDELYRAAARRESEGEAVRDLLRALGISAPRGRKGEE